MPKVEATISQTLKNKLKAHAKKDGTSQSDLIRQLLHKFFKMK